MSTLYACPYCGQDSYAPSSKKKGKFTNWKSISRHLSKCDKNNNSYIISDIHGPIPLEEIVNTDIRILRKKYPNTSFKDKLKYTNVKKDLLHPYTQQEVIDAIKIFYSIYNRIPAYREFDSPYNNYPSTPVIKRLFGTWNSAVAAAGFEPNLQNGFGVDTYGLDGHLYRSKAEAYFSDNYLHNRYKYIIEPKYPKPFLKYYDWYLTDLDIYIELDGGCRPEVIKEKISINTKLNRKVLFINTNLIASLPYTIEKFM